LASRKIGLVRPIPGLCACRLLLLHLSVAASASCAAACIVSRGEYGWRRQRKAEDKRAARNEGPEASARFAV
jgi:hypothetical protein